MSSFWQQKKKKQQQHHFGNNISWSPLKSAKGDRPFCSFEVARNGYQELSISRFVHPKLLSYLTPKMGFSTSTPKQAHQTLTPKKWIRSSFTPPIWYFISLFLSVWGSWGPRRKIGPLPAPASPPQPIPHPTPLLPRPPPPPPQLPPLPSTCFAVFLVLFFPRKNSHATRPEACCGRPSGWRRSPPRRRTPSRRRRVPLGLDGLSAGGGFQHFPLVGWIPCPFFYQPSFSSITGFPRLFHYFFFFRVC